MYQKFIRAGVSLILCGGTLAAVFQTSPAVAEQNDPPAVVDAQSAADEDTASQIAWTYGHPVVVLSETNESSQVVANSDGSFSLTSSPVPVRAQGADGTWAPLDLSLQPDGAQLTPQTAAVPVKFSAGGSAPLAQVQASTGEWLTQSWTAGPLPTPVISGDSALYPEVMPGVDLQVTATSVGMSEVLIIKNAAAASDPGLQAVEFGVNDGSMTSSVDSSGALITSSGGDTQLVSNNPAWWDSSSPGSSPAGPGGSGIPVPIEHTSTPSSITVNAASVAAKPGVVYPVYVDPPVGFSGGRISYTFTDSAHPNVGYWNGAQASDSYAHVGFINAANAPDDGLDHTTRSYWTMDTGALENRYIVTAEFQTTEVGSSSCNATPVELWTSTASSPSLTWANQNTQISLVNKLATASFAHGYSSSCPAQAEGFDVHDAVQRTADASAPTLNLALKATNESDWLSWKKFENTPVLSVSYYKKPTTPYDRNVSGCYAACSEPIWTHETTPMLRARSGLAQPGNVDYHFEVYSGWGASPTTPLVTGTLPNRAPTGDVSWPVPAGKLGDGGGYEYRVQACVYNTVACSDWSDYLKFGVDSSKPSPPKLSAVNGDFQFIEGAQANPPETRVGQQGVSGDAVISDTSQRLFQFVYVPESSLSFTASTPDCSFTSGDITSVCSTSSATISVTPQEMTSSISLVAVDIAGNVSAPASYTYFPNATTAGQAKHAWLMPFPGPASSTVTDTGINDAAKPLTLTSGVSWGTTRNGALYLNHPTYNGFLSFTGASGEAAASANTADVPADGTHGFTAAIWVKPDDRGGNTSYQTVLGQDGTANSSFYIQRTPDEHWRICMPTLQTDAASLECTVPNTLSTDAVNTQAWTLLIMVWDPTQQTMSLYVHDAASAVATASHPNVAVAGAGPIVLGRGQYHHQPTYWYQGSLSDPILYNFPLNVDQIDTLANNLPVSIGGDA